MKPKLAVGISYFNSVKEIPRLLDPIYKHVDLVIAIDGRYPLFDWPSNQSTDGSTELLQQKYNAITWDYNTGVEQITKRNKYLEIAESEGMDFVLVLDTDEYLHADYQDFKLFYKQLGKISKDENLANIWLWINPYWRKNHNVVTDNTWSQYTRIIRPNKIRYDVTHWCYVNRDNPNTFDMAFRTLDGLRFDTDSFLRTETYKQAGFNWARDQLVQENERFETPRAKRMWLGLWCRQVQKALTNPGTEIIEGKEIADKIMKGNPVE